MAKREKGWGGEIINVRKIYQNRLGHAGQVDTARRDWYILNQTNVATID